MDIFDGEYYLERHTILSDNQDKNIRKLNMRQILQNLTIFQSSVFDEWYMKAFSSSIIVILIEGT